MKKMQKLLNLCCLTPCIGFCSYALVSCGNNESKIESMVLEADKTVVLPGDTIQIKARVMPANTITNDVTWSASNISIDGPFLTRKGLLVVPEDTIVPNSTSFTVTATLNTDKTISADLEIVINPKLIDGFRGFQGNKITFVNKKKFNITTNKFEAKHVDIVNPDPNDPYTYKTAQPVDWFAGPTDSTTSPIGDLEFKFLAEFENDVPLEKQQMYFSHTNPDSQKFIFFNHYQEGSPTLTIPDAYGGSPTGEMESITVTFGIDPRLKLIIEGYTYLDPQSQDSGQAIISYDKQPGDPHEIINHGLGNYTTNLFCPVDKSRHIYRESMSTMYFHKKYFEYLDLDISVVPNNELPQPIADMLSYKYDIQRETRPNDGFQYYKVYIYYTFDLEKMGDYDPAEDGFKSYKLFTVEAWDKNYISPVFEVELECDLQWV